MRKYRNLKLDFNNKTQFLSIISDLKKLEVKDWKVDQEQSKEFAAKNNLKKEEVVSFISPYLKNLKQKSEKEIFAGIVHLGIKKNQLIVYDIISVIEGTKLRS